MRSLKPAITPRPTKPADLPFDAGAWPQVGAVLQHLDSSGPRPLDWNGSPRWDADGSAVLIAPRHALTIRHVTTADVDRDGRVPLRGVAVFFPSVGLVPVDHGFMVRGEEHRDRLLVLQLTREVPLPPIPASMVNLSDVQQPQAVGFGDWAQQDGTVYRRGVQRRLTPDLGGRLCTHDLCWNAEKDGSIAAGTNNSGGPIIERARNGYQVIGIMRRQRSDIPTLRGEDVVAATAVSRNRAGALFRTIYRVFGAVERPLEPPPVLWYDFVLDAPQLISFPVPLGTSMVYATLSAGRQWVGELLLQMRLLPGAQTDLAAGVESMILDGLARDLVSTGEFLARSLRLEVGQRIDDVARPRGAVGRARRARSLSQQAEARRDSVTVAIAPVGPLAGPVRAQLCLRFVGARPQLLGMDAAPGLPQLAPAWAPGPALTLAPP